MQCKQTTALTGRSNLRCLELVALHSLIVADIEPAVGDDGVVPRLALQCRNAGQLIQARRLCRHERNGKRKGDIQNNLGVWGYLGGGIWGHTEIN